MRPSHDRSAGSSSTARIRRVVALSDTGSPLAAGIRHRHARTMRRRSAAERVSWSEHGADTLTAITPATGEPMARRVLMVAAAGLGITAGASLVAAVAGTSIDRSVSLTALVALLGLVATASAAVVAG